MLETTTVGSLPKPEYLIETEKLWPAWRLSGEALQRAKERATVECAQNPVKILHQT